jgi:diadenosine tetraphosphatase ApaH/serine/threonine PP2A family protein phosphatase
MKIALLSDIHANIQALDACLAHARAQGAEQFALLGDFVGYGADPAAVLQRVQALAGQGAWLVKGNHDEWAVCPPTGSRTLGNSTAAWTHAQLDSSQREFLDGLPLTLERGSMALVHASLDDPGLWRYVTDQRSAAASLDALASPGVRHVFGGHVHHQTLYYRGLDASMMKFSPTAGVPIPVPLHRHWLATVGSVGQPRDGHPQAMYALFDSRRLQLAFQRVAYDHLGAAAAIRRAGLPAFFADRLEIGQ